MDDDYFMIIYIIIVSLFVTVFLQEIRILKLCYRIENIEKVLYTQIGEKL